MVNGQQGDLIPAKNNKKNDIHLGVRLICDSKLPIGVNVSVFGCLFLQAATYISVYGLWLNVHGLGP